MTDSVSRKPEVGREALAKRLAPYGQRPPKSRETIQDLPRWAKTALVRQEIFGETYKEAAKAFGKSPDTLSQYRRSPAGKKWIAEVQRLADDPVELAKAYLSTNALSITLDRIVFLESAKAAGDYSEGDKIARDLQDRIGIIAKRDTKNALSGMHITLNLAGGSATLEPITVETDHERIEEAEYEVE